jgi:hypothetical protein
MGGNDGKAKSNVWKCLELVASWIDSAGAFVVLTGICRFDNEKSKADGSLLAEALGASGSCWMTFLSSEEGICGLEAI